MIFRPYDVTFPGTVRISTNFPSLVALHIALKFLLKILIANLPNLSTAENSTIMAEELRSRNVKITNFYDVAFDYILIDRYANKRNLFHFV